MSSIYIVEIFAPPCKYGVVVPFARVRVNAPPNAHSGWGGFPLLSENPSGRLSSPLAHFTTTPFFR